MKMKLVTVLSIVAMFGFMSTTIVYAEGDTSTVESHEAHHPDTKAMSNDNDQMKMGDKGAMMGKMDMTQMTDMMHECMDTHKDKKMCHQQCMDKCQEKMGKAECQKMMKQAKKKMKINK